VDLVTDLFGEYPGSREDERDVGDHVDHGGPVDGKVADAVVLVDDVRDDRVLNPLHGVGSRVNDEQTQHKPSPFVQFELGLILADQRIRRRGCQRRTQSALHRRDALYCVFRHSETKSWSK